jgi:hypothetical protein
MGKNKSETRRQDRLRYNNTREEITQRKVKSFKKRKDLSERKDPIIQRNGSTY